MDETIERLKQELIAEQANSKELLKRTIQAEAQVKHYKEMLELMTRKHAHETQVLTDKFKKVVDQMINHIATEERLEKEKLINSLQNMRPLVIQPRF